MRHQPEDPSSIALSVLAVLGLLAAFALSFWQVSSKMPTDWPNRTQSRVLDPAEETQANKGWDPNNLLGGFVRQLPAPNTWGENFGKPLAYTKGIDADSYLYPPGTAPEPGTLIEGADDNPTDGSADAPLDATAPLSAEDAARIARPAAPVHPRNAPPKRGNGAPEDPRTPVSNLLNNR